MKNQRVDLLLGTMGMTSSADYLSVYRGTINDWRWVNGAFEVEIVDARLRILDVEVTNQRFQSAHPMDHMLALFTQAGVDTNLYDASSFNPVTVAPNIAHWMCARAGSTPARDSGVVTTLGMFGSGVFEGTLADALNDLIEILPGILHFDNQGRLAFRFLDLGASPVKTIRGSLEPISTTKYMANRVGFWGGFRTDVTQDPRTWQSEYAAPYYTEHTASIADIGVIEKVWKSKWLNSTNETVDGPPFTVLPGASSGGDDFLLAHSHLDGHTTICAMCGTHGQPTFTTGRTCTSTRYVELFITNAFSVTSSGSWTYELISINQIDPTISPSVNIDLFINTRSAEGTTYDSTRRFFDVTIQRYMSEFELRRRLEGMSEFRMKVPIYDADLELGDIVRVDSSSTHKYVGFGNTDLTGVNLMVSGIDYVIDQGYIELTLLTVGAALSGTAPYITFGV